MSFCLILLGFEMKVVFLKGDIWSIIRDLEWEIKRWISGIDKKFGSCIYNGIVGIMRVGRWV